MRNQHDQPMQKIGDPRLAAYTNRTRSGRTQEFYTGNDARDWDRYKADGGGSKPNVQMHKKPDTIQIEPPKKSWYAELIDGEWWWVEGCAECNGQPRDSWGSYVECDEHNVCRTCKCTRAELTETPWGGKHGWQCNPCADAEHQAEKLAALDAMPDEYDKWDYRHNDNIVCPYCNYEIDDTSEFHSAIDHEEEHECSRCDNTFALEGDISIHWTTKRKKVA